MERKNNTWYLMTNLPGELHSCLGNHYGFRNWIEYGFKQAKNELGWADFRVTDYHQIERWWEVVSCAYLLVSLHAYNRQIDSNSASVEEKSNSSITLSPQGAKEPPEYSQHQWWDFSISWKSTLNNLRLIIQPYVYFNLINPWLKVFDVPFLKEGFLQLSSFMNLFPGYVAFNSG